jgi:hypothetical protein
MKMGTEDINRKLASAESKLCIGENNRADRSLEPAANILRSCLSGMYSLAHSRLEVITFPRFSRHCLKDDREYE